MKKVLFFACALFAGFFKKRFVNIVLISVNNIRLICYKIVT